MSVGADAVARGCGTRVAGGIYGELGVTTDGTGRDIEGFLLDPPRPVDHMANISPIGVTMIEQKGVWHIVDWIGANHYPEVFDFVEEVRRFGLSRRLPATLDFSKLTPQSRILCVHPKAWMDPDSCGVIRPGVESDDEHRYYCPSQDDVLRRVHGLGGSLICLGCCKDSVADGEEMGSLVVRKRPSFEYNAVKIPDGLKPEYKSAIFASFPFSRLTVVKAASGAHEKAMESAKKSHLPVAEVDE